MIHVGYEFDFDKAKWRSYVADSWVAFSAATLPWIFVAGYFVFVLLPAATWWRMETWKETLMAGLFASPTSAGVLFSMLAAAGLGATWVFRKARVLAIFDDLDTVLLMVPLQMLMVGLAWQLGVVVLIMGVLLWLAWRYLNRLHWPATWPWVLLYAFLIVASCEALHVLSLKLDPALPVHLEVLLPAFVLGCLLAPPQGTHPQLEDGVDEHAVEHGTPAERLAGTVISAVFMLLVGLNMPTIIGAEPAAGITSITASQPEMGWGLIMLHVLIITFLSNVGKMFPALCYRQEAPLRGRLALALAMWPRGEVGAGVLVVSLGYGLGGPILTIALLSLALNLACTGLVIVWVKKLLTQPVRAVQAEPVEA
jgi:Kef-type K+ transport system membrane component KefB